MHAGRSRITCAKARKQATPLFLIAKRQWSTLGNACCTGLTSALRTAATAGYGVDSLLDALRH
jgi:hypothetical protein